MKISLRVTLLSLSISLLIVSNAQDSAVLVRPGAFIPAKPEGLASEWATIDSLINKAELPRTALLKVNSIYEQARKKGDEGNAVRALIYRVDLMATSSDADINARLSAWQSLIRKSSSTFEISVLQVCEATDYRKYASRHWYELRDRKTTDRQQSDVRSWNAAMLDSAIRRLYHQALFPAGILNSVRPSRFITLVIDPDETGWKGSLFDLLAFNALGYYEGDAIATLSGRNSNYRNPSGFADPAEFFHSDQLFSDSVSPGGAALSLYRRMTELHLADRDTTALLQATIERIAWYKTVSAPGYEKIYLSALKRLTHGPYAENPESAMAWYWLAAAMKDSGDLAGARAMIDRRLAAQPAKSRGNAMMQSLLEELLSKQLTVSVLGGYTPGKAMLTMFGYKNIDSVKCRIYADDGHDWLLLRRNDDAFGRWLAGRQPVREFIVTLPRSGDLKTHRVEIAIDALQPGDYILSCSVPNARQLNPYFRDSLIRLSVSSMAAMNLGSDLFVIDRQSGAAIAGAQIILESPVRRYQAGVSDHDGHVNIPAITIDQHVTKCILPGKDSLAYLQWTIREPFNTISLSDRLRASEVTIYTDRGLYRPGQEVRFNCIAVDSANSFYRKVQPGRRLSVVLHNAQGKALDTMIVTTNAYGSASGAFRLPANLLTGYFSIRAGQASGSFRVEEYKRPAFGVELDHNDSKYKIGDTGIFTGKAFSYSGSSMQGASVHISILNLSSSSSQPFIDTTMMLDTSGRFRFPVPFTPDETTTDILIYNLTASVTLGSGESHQASKVIAVRYSPFTVTLNVSDRVIRGSRPAIRIAVTNFDNRPLRERLHVTLTRLLPPSRELIKRPWDAPDLHIIDSSRFISLFPHAPFAEEDDPAHWEHSAQVSAIDIISGTNDSISPDWASQPGWYEINVRHADSTGASALHQVVQVIDPSAFSLNGPFPDASIEDIVHRNYHIATSDPTTPIIKSLIEPLDELHSKKSFRWIRGGEMVTAIPAQFPLGANVGYAFVRFGRLFTDNWEVPPPQKDSLEITLKDFRDRVQPGAKETCTVEIKGTASAELMTGMYDASLDAISAFSWRLPGSRPYLSNNRWTATEGTVEHHSPVWGVSRFYRSFNMPYLRTDIDGSQMRSGFFGQQAMAKQTEYYAKDFVAENKMAGVAAVGNNAMRAPTVQIRGTGAIAEPLTQGDLPTGFTLRTDFRETAFFFPQLLPDSSGRYKVSFTMPDAVTKWKWISLAHTKDMRTGITVAYITSQKPLMLQVNAPRFLRTGDRIELSAHISNLDSVERTGQVSLELFSAASGNQVDGPFHNMLANQFFTIPAKGAADVHFPLEVPASFSDSLRYRMVAKAGDYSDGEQAALPVISKTITVTDGYPFLLKGNSGVTVSVKGLGKKEKDCSLTIEYASHPELYSLVSLPSLAHGIPGCSEQVANRLAALSMAIDLSSRFPDLRARIRALAGTQGLNSNAGLRNTPVDQSPWIRRADNDRRLYAQLDSMLDPAANSLAWQKAFSELQSMQGSDGGFPWFKGGQENFFIGTYILQSIGKTLQLKAVSPDHRAQLTGLAKRLASYVDAERAGNKTYRYFFDLPYFYARSLFTATPLPDSTVRSFEDTVRKHWPDYPAFIQAMAGSALMRLGRSEIALKAILPSMLEREVTDKEKGVYWKGRASRYSGYYSSVSEQTRMLEFMRECATRVNSGPARTASQGILQWLLYEKQGTAWETGMATSDACYALLSTGTSSQQRGASFTAGNTVLAESGQDYLRKSFNDSALSVVSSDRIIVRPVNGSSQEGVSTGAIYYQYAANMDSLQDNGSDLRVRRQVFTDRKGLIAPLEPAEEVKPGERLIIRLTVTSNRDLDFIDLSDMKAASVEPVDALSGYRRQGGLWFYHAPGDAVIHYYIDHISRGVYTVEYPVVVNQSGTFSAGIATIQSMYAPAFSGRSAAQPISSRREN